MIFNSFKIEFVGQRPFLLGQKIIIGTSYRYNINKYKTSNEINGLRGSNSWRARFECGRSCVRASVGSIQRL
jgi:hypothetical protein